MRGLVRDLHEYNQARSAIWRVLRTVTEFGAPTPDVCCPECAGPLSFERDRPGGRVVRVCVEHGQWYETFVRGSGATGLEVVADDPFQVLKGPICHRPE